MARNLTYFQNRDRKRAKAEAKAAGWQFHWFPFLGVTIVSMVLGETVRAFWSRASSTEPQATRKAGEFHALQTASYVEMDPEYSGQAFDAQSFDAWTLAEMVSSGERDEVTGEML